jgi:molybdopterin converting factor small subunit
VAVVRYFAAARAAAGTTEEPVPAGSLEELAVTLSDRYGERMALLLKACSFLNDGVSCRDLSTPLEEQSTVDILPPFAGG